MDYRIVKGAENIKLDDIVRLLRMTYWADKRPVEQIKKSVENSACYGIYAAGEEKLSGFIRVITDFATTYYLCDVVVDEKYRESGLGHALLSHILAQPEYSAMRGVLLTRDAHGFYEKFGFERLEGRAMTKASE